MSRIRFIFASVAVLIMSGCGTDRAEKNQTDPSTKIDLETNSPEKLELSPELRVGAETAWNNCTAGWVARMDTNHLTPQWYSGDTHAAYGLFAFKANRRNRYVFKMKGRVPDARFFSFESYEGPLMGLGDHIFDHQILGTPEGQVASHHAGYPYSLLVHAPEDQNRAIAQTPGYARLALTKSKIRRTIKTIMFRIYAPSGQKQVTAADFPQVFAYDPVTGRPKACPQVHHFKPFDIPQQMVTAMRGMKATRTLDFDRPPKWFSIAGLGTNTAVKEYVINTTRMENPNDLAVIQFRAPYFATKRTYGHVRYWSFCFPNFAENKTLSCLPDYIAEKDQGKIVTVVYGKSNPVVEQAAKNAGYYFMPDSRRYSTNPRDIQKVSAFVYRNMMTTPGFAPYSYRGDYRPRGKVCTTQEFVNSATRQYACLR